MKFLKLNKILLIGLFVLNLILVSQIKGIITYKEGSDGRVVPYPTSGVGDIRLQILNEVWATDPDISSFTILEMMGYIKGDSINSSSSDYSRGYNDGYSKYDSDLQSFLLENYGKATVSEAVTVGIEAGLTIGETSVTSNSYAFNLVTQSAYDEMMNEFMSVSDVDTTPYSEGWFFLPNNGWLSATRTTYPYFFDSTSKAWMYFQSGNEKPKFYHYVTKEWMTVKLTKHRIL